MSEQPEAEAALLLHGYELRLLRCTLASSLSNPQNQPPHRPVDVSAALLALIEDILTSIEAGDYLRALSSEAAGLFVQSADDSYIDSAECADRVYSDILDRVQSFVLGENESREDDRDKDKGFRVMLVICVAIAAFLGFTQGNMTG